jgi:hypothetical protein
MSTFALSSGDTQEDIIGAINYALANLGSNTTSGNSSGNISGNIFANGNILVANTVTGVVSSVTNTGATQVPVISYLYNYINVKYANSASGGTGFTSNSAYANYYGLHNTTDGTISNNPTDYTWSQVAGGFGATKQLYYSTKGGNQINFSVATSTPSVNFTPVLDNTAIFLATLANSIVVTQSILPASVTNPTIANTAVNTQNLYQLATFNISYAQAPVGAPTPITYINGTGYWPNNTRGLPVTGGVSIIPTGNGAVDGSRIVVNYNSYISTDGNPDYLLVELWKQTQTPYYLKNFQSVAYSQPTNLALANIANPRSNNVGQWILMGGDNGYIGYSYNGGNTITTQAAVDGSGNPTVSSTSITAVAAQTTWGYPWGPTTGGDAWQTSFWNAPGYYQETEFNINTNPQFSAVVTSNVAPGTNSGFTFVPYDTIYPTATRVVSGTKQYSLQVGTGGVVAWYMNPYSTATPVIQEQTNILADLYSVCQDRAPLSSNVVNVKTVAVGSVGTVIYCERTYDISSSTFTGNLASRTAWLQYNSQTPYNLNSVASNYTASTFANLYVAVGEFGTVTTSPNGQTWTLGTTGFSGTLNGVAYGNGQWVTVGAGGTILTSNNATSWSSVSNPAANVALVGSARTLNDVTYNPYTNTFVAVGEEIVLTALGSNVASWTTTYLGTATFSSNISRVQFYGSWEDVNATYTPGVTQKLANNQVFNGVYTDNSFVKGIPATYFMVAGSLNGSVQTTYAGEGSMTVTEYKR